MRFSTMLSKAMDVLPRHLISRRPPIRTAIEVREFDIEDTTQRLVRWDVQNADVERHDAAVLALEYLDAFGVRLPPPYPGCSASRAFPAYRYLSCVRADGEAAPAVPVFPPSGAARLRVTLHAWKVDRLKILAEPVLLRPGGAEGRVEARTVAPLPAPSPSRKGRTEAAATVEIEAGATYIATAEFIAAGPMDDRAAVLTAQFVDASGATISPPYGGFSDSDEVGSYRYVSITAQGGESYRLREFIEPPAGAVGMRLRLLSWSASLSKVAPLRVMRGNWETFLAGVEPGRLQVGALRRLTDMAMRQGDPIMATRLCAEAVAKGGGVESERRLGLLQGLTRELRTDWLPRLAPHRGALIPDPSVIFHLFKVIYPQESSGGAVRNWSIVRAQAQDGLRPVAMLPLTDRLEVDGGDDREAGPSDALFHVEREGVDVIYPRYSPLRRRSTPADAILEVEADLAARAAAECRASLIHAASGFKGFETALKGLAVARRLGLPFVYEVRSFHEHTWAPLRSGVLEAPMTRLRIAQENRCMAEADAVVTISEVMAELLRARGAPAARLDVVPNSVDDSFLDPPDAQAAAALRQRFGLGGGPVIGYVSNMSLREGHDVLLQAFARIARETPSARCLLIGDGPRRPALELLAQELGVADRVVMPGVVDHASIREAYSLIDVFVVPRLPDYASDHVTPMKPFEAMALGCRLIMADRPVTPEILGADERGLSFRTGEPESLAEAIRTVLAEPDAALARSSRAHAWIRSQRTWQRNALLYREIYAKARRTHAALRRIGRMD